MDLSIGKNNQPNQSPRLLRNHPAQEGRAGISSLTKPSRPQADQKPEFPAADSPGIKADTKQVRGTVPAWHTEPTPRDMH